MAGRLQAPMGMAESLPECQSRPLAWCGLASAGPEVPLADKIAVPRSNPQSAPDVNSQSRWGWPGVALALGLMTFWSLHALRTLPFDLSWRDAFTGAREVIAATGPAAVRIWLFWGCAALLTFGIVERIDPSVDPGDAMLIGAASPWVIGAVLGVVLGPWGLFNPATIWGLMIAGAAWLWRHPPALRFPSATPGRTLALLAVVLLGVSYLPLQLASPVVPFMDVLSYPSSVQRILTFHRYLPFDNDPYGCWGPYAQTPYLELFYAALAMGSGTQLAVLAESAAMMPMAALLIFAAYRLGKTFFDDTAGGFAALLLFLTCLFRRAQGMRGTAVAFAIIALGLALFLDPRIRRVAFFAGSAMLGIGVGSHAIIGGLGLLVAGFGLVLPLAEGDSRRVRAGVIALSGAALIALPELLIGLSRAVPVTILAMSMLAGIALIGLATLMLDPLPQNHHLSETAARAPDFALRLVNGLLIGGFLLALVRHLATPYPLAREVFDNLPILATLCLAGLLATLALMVLEHPLRLRYAGLAALPLVIATVGDLLDPALRSLAHNAASGMMTSDVHIKLFDYWCPFFLIFPAGLLCTIGWQRVSRPLTLLAVMALLLYPFGWSANDVYYDSLEHSVTELWAFNLDTAAHGYWQGHIDTRWTFSRSEMGLIDTLNREIAHGRITVRTHVLHLADTIYYWRLQQFAILTGIDDDIIEYQHDPNNQWEGGSRVRGLDQLPAAFQARPPYILIQDPPPRWFVEPPPGYDRIWSNGPVRLYRRADLAHVDALPPSEPFRRYGLGVVLLLLAGFIVAAPRTTRRPPIGLPRADAVDTP